MTIAIISHPQCREHVMSHRHPEAPARLESILKSLRESHLDYLLEYYEAPLAELAHLSRAHDSAYLEELEASAPQQSDDIYWIDGDTALTAHTLTAARRAAGAAVLAVELVLTGKAHAAFCAIRPPGHHAERSRAMGFCYYNNVAIAAYHALEWGKLERVAIVDFDVHHGNGTEDIVSGDSRILFCSSFQYPFYPYQGANSKAENVCNLPLPAETNGNLYRAVVEKFWLPRLEAFRPQLVLFPAGFDGHAMDNMSAFQLVESDYAWLTRQVKSTVQRHGEWRAVSCLEGGYNLSVLGDSALAHIEMLD